MCEAHRPAFELGYEGLLTVQEVELVRVQRLLNRIDDYIHLIISIQLGNLVAGSYGSAIPLSQVRGTPRRVQKMDANRSLLGIYTCSEHTRRTEQDSYIAAIHSLNDCLSATLTLTLLNEAYLVSRNTIIFYQLALDFGIDIPLAGLVCPEVTENKLCAFLCVIFTVVFGNHFGTVRGFVVRIILGIGVNHAHVKSYFAGIVCGNEHLCLFLSL